VETTEARRESDSGYQGLAQSNYVPGTPRIGEWLEAHHLAGLAILEVLFIVVSAFGALELTRREWQGDTLAGVAHSYLIVFGAMLVVSVVGGFLLLLAAWTWALLDATARVFFYRFPWWIVGGVAAGYLIARWWAKLQPESKKLLKELLPWAKGETASK